MREFSLGTMLFLYPLMSMMEMISARIGRVTGHGLAANMRRIFPAWAVSGLVALLFITNTINIGAELAAMDAAAELVLGWGSHPSFARRSGGRCAEAGTAAPASNQQ